MALIWNAKFFCFTALLEGICASLNLYIQTLKLYIYYYIDICLKDVFFWHYHGERKNSENKMPVKNTVKKVRPNYN